MKVIQNHFSGRYICVVLNINLLISRRWKNGNFILQIIFIFSGCRSPDGIDPFGIINKRIAIVLYGIHFIVAVNFFGTYRIKRVPFQQHVFSPVAQIAAAERSSAPRRHFIFVADAHVEINSCKITLEAVNGLKHSACISWIAAGSSFAAILRSPVGGTNLTVGPVAALSVYFSVGRNNMKNIAVHRRRSTEPALRNRVFTVVAITFAAVVAALVRNQREFVWGCSAGNVGIHIPQFAVGFYIGNRVHAPEIVIGCADKSGGNNIMQSCF
ncbi:hypothetical protein SDC9_125467 [bioreactor metagenome]|uniref:Uncharacterized protein n=1 Tax=bioreactor metagenome TaxID=1076179 RepID=A0A645CN51_9ZZZZ